jgi:hypothetical protein
MIQTDYQESATTAAGAVGDHPRRQSGADDNAGADAWQLKKAYPQLSCDFVEEFAVKQGGGI